MWEEVFQPGCWYCSLLAFPHILCNATTPTCGPITHHRATQWPSHSLFNSCSPCTITENVRLLSEKRIYLTSLIPPLFLYQTSVKLCYIHTRHAQMEIDGILTIQDFFLPDINVPATVLHVPFFRFEDESFRIIMCEVTQKH